jgi:hypothetical protein
MLASPRVLHLRHLEHTVKSLRLCSILLLACSAALAQTTINNIDDSTVLDPGGGTYGWGWCTTCAGGQNEDLVTIWTAANQTTPSRDGASREFQISGPAYGNGLWWYKVGPLDTATNFQSDFFMQVNGGANGAQNIEFDVFQFVGGQRYMFGTQCSYYYGVWDTWDELHTRWVHTAVACPKFKPNTWYRIVETFHRTPDTLEHYDSIRVIQYGTKNRIVSDATYALNLTQPSGPLPSGWNENAGLQFQLDIGPNGTSMAEWVDQVSLTAW